MRIETDNLNRLIQIANHKITNIETNMTNIESDIKWLKIIGYYMCTLITLLFVGVLI